MHSSIGAVSKPSRRPVVDASCECAQYDAVTTFVQCAQQRAHWIQVSQRRRGIRQNRRHRTVSRRISVAQQVRPLGFYQRPSHDGGNIVAVSQTSCGTCGTEPRAGARFCDACGSPIASHRGTVRTQAGDGAFRRCGALDGPGGTARFRTSARGDERVVQPLRSHRRSATAARWTSSPETASWRSSVRRSRSRTMPPAHVWRLSRFNEKRGAWPRRCNAATVSNTRCGSD